MTSLVEQIENVWNSSEYTKPSIVLITGQDQDNYIVISETSSTCRTLDRNGQVIIVSKSKNSTHEQSNTNVEMIHTECHYMSELDNFVMDFIHHLVFV